MKKLPNVPVVCSFMRLLLATLLLAIAVGADGQKPSNVSIVKLSELEQLISSRGSTVRIFNFWATWCAPCVKELPYFEKLSQLKGNHEVYLVNMDLDLDPDPEKVYRFVDRRQLESPVLMLDEADPNSWIDKIDERWSGALPATLVINTGTGKRAFVESSLQEGELEKIIDSVK